MEVQNYVPGQGYSEPRSRQLTRDEFARLIESLDKFEIEELPANLYAKDYTDVRLEVLSWKKDVQARAFSGMTPQTHGAKQQQFERLTGLLTQLTSDISPPASREPR